MEVYTIENELFRIYLTYATLLVFKMFFLALYTVFIRTTKEVFANREDYGYTYPEEKFKERQARADASKEKVERIRRCHLNDLENIPVFLIVGLLYLAINPPAHIAIWHYRVFVASRFFHMVAYLTPLPQPSRALSFVVGTGVTISMGVQILRSVAQF